ncbi:MAG: hypothetical protein J0L81_08150 [Caulobacterales bacterium]|jgi:hypothetical protein|nr:hypothetical protein [Caulobacterales bacterium]
MPPEPKPKPRATWLIVALLLAAAIILPSVMAGGLGRVLADVWVSTMAAIAGLIGGLFGN